MFVKKRVTTGHGLVMRGRARGYGLGEVTPPVPSAQSSSGFLDMITKTIGTIAQGAVQYKLNSQAIKSGQGNLPYGGTPAVQITEGEPSAPINQNMLIAGAIALGGMFLLLRKRR